MFIVYEPCYNLLLIIYSLNVLIYLKTFSYFFQNPVRVSPHGARTLRTKQSSS